MDGPGMFGAHVHRAVIDSGDSLSGASVHLVEEDYDTGPVLAQRSVEVMPDDTPDTLAARVQTAERSEPPPNPRLYPTRTRFARPAQLGPGTLERR